MTDKKDENFKSVVITGLGVVAVFLVYVLAGSLATSDFDWSKALAPYALWLGLALLIFYQFLFLTNSRIATVLRGEVASQAFLTVLIAFSLLSSSIEAAGAINRVFSVDASAFPNTLRIMTFIEALIMGKTLFWILLGWSVLAFLYFLSGGEKSWQTWIFALSGIAVSSAALLAIYDTFSSEKLDKRVYLLARTADFYTKVHCPGREVKGSAIFLGPDQRRILVDQASIKSFSLTEVLTMNSETFPAVPATFPIYGCKENN